MVIGSNLKVATIHNPSKAYNFVHPITLFTLPSLFLESDGKVNK